jgi:hypothetical protein
LFVFLCGFGFTWGLGFVALSFQSTRDNEWHLRTDEQKKRLIGTDSNLSLRFLPQNQPSVRVANIPTPSSLMHIEYCLKVEAAIVSAVDDGGRPPSAKRAICQFSR